MCLSLDRNKRPRGCQHRCLQCLLLEGNYPPGLHTGNPQRQCRAGEGQVGEQGEGRGALEAMEEGEEEGVVEDI